LDIRRTSNVFNSDQAYWVAVGGEDIARYYLEKDRNDSGTDHLNEDWVEPLTLPIEHGAVAGQLEDLQGRFNINNLI
jgi:general secretion pathway protein K